MVRPLRIQVTTLLVAAIVASVNTPLALAASRQELDRDAKIVKEVQIRAPIFPEVRMVADVIFRGNGVSELMIVEVKSGEARLSKQQAAILAKALNTGDVLIVNKDAADTLKIRPNETFKAQRIQPLVVVIGGRVWLRLNHPYQWEFPFNLFQ